MEESGNEGANPSIDRPLKRYRGLWIHCAIFISKTRIASQTDITLFHFSKNYGLACCHARSKQKHDFDSAEILTVIVYENVLHHNKFLLRQLWVGEAKFWTILLFAPIHCLRRTRGTALNIEFYYPRNSSSCLRRWM